MQEQSPLLLLPREVRDRIYEFYLTIENEDFEVTLQPRLLFMDSDAAFSRPLPTLMLTCKALYQELYGLVHEQAAMRVENRGWNDRKIGFAVRGVLRFDRLEKLLLMVTTEHPNWNSWLYFFRDVVARAPNLKALVIDWNPRPVLSTGWSGRVNLKKETEFFGAIASLKKLHRIQIHGEIPARWMDQLEKMAKVSSFGFRYWKEPGLEW
ncbi:hypothetical protein GGR54DRAFT_547702 [Hypoxylon sp. NC1633]|nr:hypothetical protein GGR54DRAFT_547702 [Hypoxylon sp. NC1633]